MPLAGDNLGSVIMSLGAGGEVTLSLLSTPDRVAGMAATGPFWKKTLSPLSYPLAWSLSPQPSVAAALHSLAGARDEAIRGPKNEPGCM